MAADMSVCDFIRWIYRSVREGRRLRREGWEIVSLVPFVVARKG